MLDRLWRWAGRTVLIVSDRPADPAINTAFLRQPDIRLLTSPPGLEALRIARRKRPSLIIEDVRQDSGFACVQALREDPGTCSIPMILVTEAALRDRARSAHADATLIKPIERKTYFDAVRRFITLPKRRMRRYDANLRFQLSAKDHQGQAFCRDLSASGAFLKTDRILPLGTRLEVCFQLPGEPEAIRCEATVVRTHRRNGTALQGFAIEFCGMREDELQQLENHIETHVAHSPQ